MSDKVRYILIVDPLISTEYTVRVFRKYGFKIFALWTKEVDIPYFKNSITIDLFDKSLLSTQNFEKDVESINKELFSDAKISLVICGTDSSVAYSDQLNSYFCPYLANDSKTSVLRFDKFQMIQALKDAGLPTQYQFHIRNVKEFQSNKYNYPMIVKPTAYSSSSYGVKKCFNKEEATKQIEAILSKSSMYGYDTTALIQEYIDGEEYAVNTVSYKGQHYLISVSRYDKNISDGQFLYKSQELIRGSSLLKLVNGYISQVLDILGVKTGFAHTEIKIQDGIPYLIELNPRPAGSAGCANYIEKQACGIDQQEALCRLLLDLPINIQQIKENYLLYFLNNFNTPYDQLNLEPIQHLSSYLDSRILKSKDSSAKNNRDFSLNDTACYIILKNKDINNLYKDKDCIDELVKEEKVFRLLSFS
ncbi:ATP-grasp domain-containing protein [Cysteiniphilum halobium]|uniref:ATP-grasp domain-containing protein n=1 Tax=Cysteiniphilum halobium TaxID=2219059 RepID=UPI000E64C5BE|nr:ATP-grasp domain-containing protein [Cysteiniphilum halobium]